jgi:hypothetical protein
MDVAKLVADLETKGVDLWAETGQLQFRAPKGLLTEERMNLRRTHTGQILALLSAERDDADGLEVNWGVRQDACPDAMVEDMFTVPRGSR